MDKDELYYFAVDLLKRLIAVPRFSREENAAADIVEKTLRETVGDKAVIKRVDNNVIATPTAFSPDRPILMLNSHLDTVRPVSGWTVDPFSPIFDPETDRLTGLGSNDAGASLVSLMSTFLYFITNDIASSYNLLLVASAEEEVSGKNGMESIVPLLSGVDLAIIGEPTGMNPAVAEKGLIVIDATVEGVSGHAARNEGVNAIYRAMPVISAIRSFRFPKESEWLGPVVMNVTQINSGTQHNVVPDRCDLVIDVRTTDAYTNAETFELIGKALPDYCTLKPRSLRLNPSYISPDNPLVQRIIMLGGRPFGSPTLSDQALLPFPSVKLGPGASSRSHTADEYILLSEIREAIELYISILR